MQRAMITKTIMTHRLDQVKPRVQIVYHVMYSSVKKKDVYFLVFPLILNDIIELFLFVDYLSHFLRISSKSFTY